MDTLEIARWCLSALLAAAWLVVAVGNGYRLVNALWRDANTSLVLFVGGLVGALAAVICPADGVIYFAWLPPLLDFGCAPALGVIITMAIAGRLQKS